jgi:3-oxoadipate enol-lactonase
MMGQKAGVAYEKTTGMAKTRDGIVLPYTICGDTSLARPRIVLIHSLAMDGTVWEAVAERLVRKATVLTYDCRGHGSSTKAPGPYLLETFARDLADLLDHLGWNRAHIAGASMGGSVALQFAVLYPERTQSLGLIDTTAWYGPEAPQKWEWRATEAKQKGLKGLIEFQQTRWFTDKFRHEHQEILTRCCDIFLANDVDAFGATCRMLGAFDLRDKLSAIRVPCAILVGDEDYATPPDMARVLEQGIPGATLVVVPQARHLTFMECPDVVAAVLSKLMDRCSAG